MNTLNSLEDRVTRMLLAGDDEALVVLREQIQQAEVLSRKWTGVGFFTEFLIPSTVTRLVGCSSFKLGDVDGTASNIKDGLGFLLYISDGYISMLEGYTYGDSWPNEVEGLQLAYSGGIIRDMEKVRRIIHTSRVPLNSSFPLA
jgi:hypothetical protein